MERKKTIDLLREYGTNDPFELCACLGISIYRLPLTENVHGVCYTDDNGSAIAISDDISDQEALFVCGHELGHLVMHHGTNSIFLESKTHLKTSKYEKQANVFALLLMFPSDDEFLEYGDTVSKIAANVGLREELVALRLEQIEKI